MMRTHNKSFHNSGFYFIVLLFLAVIGFWQSYFSKLFGDINSYIHFHAITMMLWVGMLIMVCHEHRLLGDQRLCVLYKR